MMPSLHITFTTIFRPRPTPLTCSRCLVQVPVPLRQAVGVCRSMRESKDPKSFQSMDELREYLHNKERSPLTFANMLNFLSQASMGSGPPESYPDDPSTSSSPMARLSLLPGLMSRGVAKGIVTSSMQLLLQSSGGSMQETQQMMRSLSWPQLDPEKYSQLEPIMAGVCSLRSLRKAAYKYPALLDMAPAELAIRLVVLKELLGGCDVAFLVEQEPVLYLGDCREDVEAQVGRGMGLLCSGLAGADINQIVLRDPRLIFMPELEHGIRELRDLWDVDEDALAASDPMMLALAVRALSVTGLPKGL